MFIEGAQLCRNARRHPFACVVFGRRAADREKPKTRFKRRPAKRDREHASQQRKSDGRGRPPPWWANTNGGGQRFPDVIASRMLLELPSRLAEALEPHLMLTDLHAGQVICRPDESVRDIHFINRGLVSLVKRMKDGAAVEIGTMGIEGCTAPEVLFWNWHSTFRSCRPGAGKLIRDP